MLTLSSVLHNPHNVSISGSLVVQFVGNAFVVCITHIKGGLYGIGCKKNVLRTWPIRKKTKRNEIRSTSYRSMRTDADHALIGCPKTHTKIYNKNSTNQISLQSYANISAMHHPQFTPQNRHLAHSAQFWFSDAI